MKKQKVLVVCHNNNARSQMAEAWLNFLYGERFEAKSAGLEPGELNPLVVKVMEEAGIDISKNQTQSVFDILKSGESFSWVITICDETTSERYPVFPGSARHLRWNFPDPSALSGSLEEKLNAVRKIRCDIKAAVRQWGAIYLLATHWGVCHFLALRMGKWGVGDEKTEGPVCLCSQ